MKSVIMDERSKALLKQWTLAQPIVSAFITGVIRNFRDRDDLLQEVAVAIIESQESYDLTKPFIPWAMGITKNHLSLYFRKKNKERIVFCQDTIEMIATAYCEIPTEEMAALNYLQDCLEKLEGRAKQICDLRYQEDLKPAAIARQLGMTANTVSKSLQRIREQLQDCIERKSALEGGAS